MSIVAWRHGPATVHRVVAAVLTAVLAVGLAVTAAPTTAAAGSAMTLLSDVTNTTGTVTGEYGTTGAEGIDKVIDNSAYQKYFTNHPTGWLQFDATTPVQITEYWLTSANDSSDRDPTFWVFQGPPTARTGPRWTPDPVRASSPGISGRGTPSRAAPPTATTGCR